MFTPMLCFVPNVAGQINVGDYYHTHTCLLYYTGWSYTQRTRESDVQKFKTLMPPEDLLQPNCSFHNVHRFLCTFLGFACTVLLYLVKVRIVYT